MSNVLFSIFPNEHFMDLTLYQFGYEKCAPLHSFGPFLRNHYLFHYVISGKGTLHSNDAHNNAVVYHLTEGSGFLIEPEFVNLYYADEKEPWEYIWLEFGGLRAKEFLEIAGLSREHPVFTPDTPLHGEELLNEMFSIVRNTAASPLGQIGHLYLFMDRLIAGSSVRRKLQGGRLSEFYAREAVTFIEQNYSRNITVSDMAKRCSLERSYFGKIFKDVMGQSPQDFLIHYRMSKAAEALKLTDSSIGEIGSSVGYSNQLHFSRAFKNVWGISPREYRQKYRLIPPGEP